MRRGTPAPELLGKFGRRFICLVNWAFLLTVKRDTQKERTTNVNLNRLDAVSTRAGLSTGKLVSKFKIEDVSS